MLYDEDRTRYHLGLKVLVLFLLVAFGFALCDEPAHGQSSREELKLRVIVKYNNVTSELASDMERIEGAWKMYAAAQGAFARQHNMDRNVVDLNDRDPDRLNKLRQSAHNASEALIDIFSDISGKMKEQQKLLKLLVDHLQEEEYDMLNPTVEDVIQ